MCGDKGWVTFGAPVGHPNFGKVVPCECQEERLQTERVERLLNFSNLKQLDRYNFETIDPNGRAETIQGQNLYKVAYDAARKFADNPAGWIVFKGPTGVGKTHLAAAIGNQLVTNEHDFLGQIGTYGSELGGMIWPTSLVLDLEDNLYLADEYLQRITKFDREGNAVTHWGEKGQCYQ